MPVRTRLSVLGSVLFAATLVGPHASRADDGPALVPPPDAEILGEFDDEDDWAIESLRFRFSYLLQEGRGFQSKDGPPDGPGDEELVVIQPLAEIQIRQSENIDHKIYFPVDLVTSASSGALDAISQASVMTEATTLDITTSYHATKTFDLNFRYGAHWEEPMTSFFGGLGFSKSMADDNAVLAVDTFASVDLFDFTDPDGFDLGVTSRATYSGNVSLSQILSPTTIAALSYGVTHQRGTLEQTWNSLAVDGNDERIAERFPNTRTRHAVGGRVAQHIPASRSTVKAGYRYYLDDFDLSAHTFDIHGYQYIGPNFYVRGSYRYYTQSAVEFFRTSVPLEFDLNLSRTADSDLGAYHVNEYGFRCVYQFNAAGSSKPGNEYFGVSFARYDRSTGLDINLFSVSYGESF